MTQLCIHQMNQMNSRNGLAMTTAPGTLSLHFAWVVDHEKCIVVTRVCVCFCVAAACQHYCTDPDVTWRSDRGCPLVVHYWADLQSVHGLRCYGNITRTRNVSEYMLVLALCLVGISSSSIIIWLTAKSARTLAVVGVSIQGTVRTSTVARVLLTVVTVVVTQTRLCSHRHIHTYNSIPLITFILHNYRPRFPDHVGGLARAVGRMCASPCVWTTVELHDLIDI